AICERSANDRQHRCQARSPAHAEHGPSVFAPQVGRAKGSTHPQIASYLQLIEKVLCHTPAVHPANLELHLFVVRQAGHGIRPDVVWRELKGRVLARTELKWLGQLDPDSTNVVRGMFNGNNGTLEDLCRMGHDLIHIRDLDGAV